MSISKAFTDKVETVVNSIGSQREKVIHPLLLEAVILTAKSRNTAYIELVLNQFETLSTTIRTEQIKLYFTQVAAFKVSINSETESFKVTMTKGFDYTLPAYIASLKDAKNRYWLLGSKVDKPKKVCDFLKVMNGVEIQLARTLNLGLTDTTQLKGLLESTLNNIILLSSSEKVLEWCDDYNDQQAVESHPSVSSVSSLSPKEQPVLEMTEQEVLEALVVEQGIEELEVK